eukprot:892696-Pelagomonas_calceolata.AAC.18
MIFVCRLSSVRLQSFKEAYLGKAEQWHPLLLSYNRPHPDQLWVYARASSGEPALGILHTVRGANIKHVITHAVGGADTKYVTTHAVHGAHTKCMAPTQCVVPLRIAIAYGAQSVPGAHTKCMAPMQCVVPLQIAIAYGA